MKRLATPEGAKELSSKVEPLRITQGLQPLDQGRSDDAIEQRPLQDRAVHKVSIIESFTKEQILFTLAPLYFTLSIPFDLTAQFQGTNWGKDSQCLRLSTSFKVLEDIPGWENMLETVDKEHWPQLVQFMGELMFKRQEFYWTVCGDFVNIPSVSGSMVPVAVFTPRTVSRRFVPWVDDHGLIRFSLEETSDAFVQNSHTRKLGLFYPEGQA